MGHITFEFLGDHPQHIPLIAQWYYDEWGHAMKDRPVEKIQELIRGMLHRNKIPLHILAMEGTQVLGVAQLKIREMDIYPEKTHWLGGVFISPTARHRGLASRLVGKALELATSFNVETLYLQTERLDGGLYAKLGWKPIEETHYNGKHVLVMEKALSVPNA